MTQDYATCKDDDCKGCGHDEPDYEEDTKSVGGESIDSNDSEFLDYETFFNWFRGNLQDQALSSEDKWMREVRRVMKAQEDVGKDLPEDTKVQIAAGIAKQNTERDVQMNNQCFSCGEGGHRARHGPLTVCFNCNEVGHIKKDCKHARPGNHNKGELTTAGQEAGESKEAASRFSFDSQVLAEEAGKSTQAVQEAGKAVVVEKMYGMELCKARCCGIGCSHTALRVEQQVAPGRDEANGSLPDSSTLDVTKTPQSCGSGSRPVDADGLVPEADGAAGKVWEKTRCPPPHLGYPYQQTMAVPHVELWGMRSARPWGLARIGLLSLMKRKPSLNLLLKTL